MEEKYWTSEEHKLWLELAHNRPLEKNVGHWECRMENHILNWYYYNDQPVFVIKKEII